VGFGGKSCGIVLDFGVELWFIMERRRSSMLLKNLEFKLDLLEGDEVGFGVDLGVGVALGFGVGVRVHFGIRVAVGLGVEVIFGVDVGVCVGLGVDAVVAFVAEVGMGVGDWVGEGDREEVAVVVVAVMRFTGKLKESHTSFFQIPE
jgi:hypothetical protein